MTMSLNLLFLSLDLFEIKSNFCQAIALGFTLARMTEKHNFSPVVYDYMKEGILTWSLSPYLSARDDNKRISYNGSSIIFLWSGCFSFLVIDELSVTVKLC